MLSSFDTSAPTSWTSYTYTYVVTSTRSTFRVSSATDLSNKDWYIDNVLISSTTSPGTNLVSNWNFESGASVGWSVFSCGGSCSATISSSNKCQGGSGFCYNNACTPATNMQFLQQSINTTVGTTYNVTFSVLKGGSGNGPGTGMYVNMF